LIAYDTENTGIIIDGYDDLLAPELFGKIVFLDDENALLGISNLILGKEADAIESFEQNVEVLQTLKRNAIQIGGIYPEDLLITGEAKVGVMFTSELGYATQYNENLEVVYPNEGFLYSLDVMAVPKNAKGASGAHLLMNYIHDPMVNGKLITEISCSTTNISAEQFMDEEYRNSDGYNIDSDKAQKGILMKEISKQKQEEFSTVYKQYFKG
ncbi:MAG: extracellular solute-binding protein, partial [Clostridia bacterium]|nr:extracellular solute-binding protein [Clostridia bacterium]